MTEFLQTIPTMETTEQIQRILNQFVGTNVGAYRGEKKWHCRILCTVPRTLLLLISRAEEPKWLIGSLLAPSLKYTHTTPPAQQFNVLQISLWFPKQKLFLEYSSTPPRIQLSFLMKKKKTENYKKQSSIIPLSATLSQHKQMYVFQKGTCCAASLHHDFIRSPLFSGSFPSPHHTGCCDLGQS